MANNKIQIKRSTANAVVTGLSNGELAFTQAGNVFFIGAPDGTSGSIRIGGQMVPGTLTANQALVANATSGIDKIIAANVAANSIWANGSAGTSGQLLTSNGTIVYWSTPASAASGADTQVQFNDGGTTLNATAGFTFTKASNNVFIGNTLTIGTATVNTTNYTGTANNATNLGGTAAASYQLNSTLAANVAILTANNANNLGTVAAANYVQNTDSRTLSGNLNFSGANVTFAGANLTVTGTNSYFSSNVNIAGTNTVISSNVTLTGATLTGTSTDVTLRNGTFSGNLVVSGTVVTVNTQQLVVNDNIIELGLNNTTTDVVDTGFFSPAGNSTAIWYSGIARIAASSTNTNPVFRVFVSNTNPNTSATIDTSSNTRTGTIQSFLQPYGSGGAFVANATAIALTANSTVSVAITGNTLALSTPLPGTSGGTGLATTVNNSLYFGNSTNGFNALALNTTGGYVLQSNGTAIVYDILDGGTF